jgi:hypothetical protein
VINPSGVVEADKAFVLESLELDGFVIESWKLPPAQIFLQCQDGTKFPGTYWAFNGHAQVIIDRDDPVLWILDHPSILEMPENG